MKIDFKETTWRRIDIPEDKRFEVLMDLRKGKNASYICNKYRLSAYFIDDCSEEMTVPDNQFCSTIEVYNDDELIYENGGL